MDDQISPTTKYEFKVWYKANPHYTGHWNGFVTVEEGTPPVAKTISKIGSGLHGTFDSLARAQFEAKKAKDWFSIERVNDNVKDGEVQNEKIPGTIKESTHDNVIVYIEEWQGDGLGGEPVKMSVYSLEDGRWAEERTTEGKKRRKVVEAA